MTREHYDNLLRDLDMAILEMGELVGDTVASSINALETRDVDEAQRLIEDESHIDDMRYAIENQVLLLIATQQPLARDLRTVAAILTIALELERIGDYCEGIAKLTLRMAAEPIVTPLTAIHSMAEITRDILQEAMVAYRDRDIKAAGAVWIRDEEVDSLYEDVFRDLLAGMAADPTCIRDSTYLLWVAHNVERIADRVTNIAERVAFVVTGDIEEFRTNLMRRSAPL